MKKYKVTATWKAHGLTITTTIYHEFANELHARESVIKMIDSCSWSLVFLHIQCIDGTKYLSGI